MAVCNSQNKKSKKQMLIITIDTVIFGYLSISGWAN